MSLLFYLLWCAPPLCLVCSFLLALRRGIHLRMPFFVSYVGFKILEFVVLLGVDVFATRISSSPLRFYHLFAVGGLVGSVALEYLVLFELAQELLLLRATFTRRLFPVLRWVAAALVICATFLAAMLSHGRVEQLAGIFQTLEFSANLVKIGLLVLLVLFAALLNVSWRSIPAGLAVGLGVWSSAEMGASALYSALGTPGYLTVDLIRMAAFLFCTVVWLVYLFRAKDCSPSVATGLRGPELELLDEQMQRMLRL